MGLFQKFFSRTRTSRWLKRETESERRARAGESSNASADKALGVAVSNVTNEHHTFIRIECRDRVGLLCDVATHLTRSGVNVVQADVTRDSRKALYTLYVCEEDSRCKLSESASEQLRNELEELVNRPGGPIAATELRADTEDLLYEPQVAEEDRDEEFVSKERSVHGVIFDDKDVANATEIKMQVLDRPGLMADFCAACVSRGVSVLRGNLFTVGDTVENCFLLLDMEHHGKVADKDVAYIKSVLLLRRHRRAISQRMSINRHADFIPTEQALPGVREDQSGSQNTQYIDFDTPVQSWEIEIFASALRVIPAVRHAGLAGLLVEALSNAATRLVFPAGVTILQQGEGADTFYLVIDGKIEVMPEGTFLKSADTWGEEVLIESTPSPSKLVAVEDSVLLGITRKTFATVIQNVMSNARKSAYEAVFQCPVFKPFEHASLEALSELLVQRGRRAYRAGEVIYRDGMQAKMFMVMDGEVECTIKGDDSMETRKIVGGGYFGDEILAGDTTIKGVYIALTDVVLLTCTQTSVLQVIGVDSVTPERTEDGTPEKASAGVNIPHADGRQRGSNNALVGLMATKSSAPNLSLFTEASPPSPSRASASPSRVFSTSRLTKPFSSFARTKKSVASTGHLPVLVEEKAIIDSPPATASKKSSALSGSLRSHSPQLTELQSAKNLNEFEVTDVLGQGMVGLVLRAKHKGSGKICAIKTMPKAQIIENGEEEHCVAEKRALEELRHAPFVCNYYTSFQDPWALYLVVEDCVGDMFDLFNQSGLPGIGQIKVYTAQVLLGLEFIHNAGYVYRDMKPENLLLRSDGSITIGDFGFAKKLAKGERAYTICGTPDYLAPELILHQGCTRAADIWAFGILVFEMIAGFPPFRDRQRRELYKRIVHADFAAVPVPRRMDNDVHDMLTQIFVRDESLRLGIRAPGIGAIKGHPWYETIDWDAVISGKLRPLHFLPQQQSRAELSSIRDAKTGKFNWMCDLPPMVNDDKFTGFDE
ncbi:camp-dependent protein kinase catalytic subunit [Ostreococcus tauri]|uniref:cGMP-dependent protein kinase n=1 Tax=Ostreococcus tauri TaxID=70448 RepID=A0A1Y5IIM8_OSTTA|nr:camp-dependent protein kinase catalytic subunit [Ostreococcus tauri]